MQAAVTDPDSDAWIELTTLSRAEVSQATGMLVAQLDITRPRRSCGCARTPTPPAAAPPTSPATSSIADCDWTPTDARSSSPDGTSVRRGREPIVTEIPRETRVLDAVVSLVDSLLDDFDVVELLTELTEHCAQLLDVASAGLLLADPRRQLHLMAATSREDPRPGAVPAAGRRRPLPGLLRHRAADLGRRPAGRGGALAAVRRRRHRGRLRLGARGADARSRHRAGRPGLVRHRRRRTQRRRSAAWPKRWPTSPAWRSCRNTPPPRRPCSRACSTALTSRVVVEQAKGFLRERLEVSVEDAFALLRHYGRTHGDHLTEVSRRLIAQPDARPEILAAAVADCGESVLTAQLGLAVASLGAPYRLVEDPLGDHGELDVLRLADPPQPVECVLGATAGAAPENADRLIDHRSASQRTL